MTTRRYLTNSAAPYTPATVKDTYNDSTLTTNVFELAEAKAGTNVALSRAETSTTNNWKVLLGRWVSKPLTGGYTVAVGADGITHTMARLESSASANMNIRLTMWVTVGDSDTVRGYLLNSFTGGTEFDITTATNLSYALTFDNSFTIQPGDRIVFELGYNAANTSATSFTGTLRAGGTAADLATTGTTGSTTNSPWVDFTGSAGFDAALVPLPPADPQFVNMGTAVTITSAANLSLAYPAGVALNRVVLAHIYMEGVGVSITPPTGWAEILPKVSGAGSLEQRLFWHRCDGTESGSVTFTHATSWRAGVMSQWSNCETTGNPFDTPASTSVAVTSGSTSPAVSDTSDVANCRVVWWGSCFNAGTWTPPTGFTEHFDATGELGAVASKTQAAAGSTGSITATCTASGEIEGRILILIPPGGAAPPADLTKFFLSAA